MRNMSLIAVGTLLMLIAQVAQGAGTNRKIIAEIDPVAPASATWEESIYETPTSKWGGNVDFNIGGILSTGPEFWVGTFVMKGDDETVSEYRREDLYPGERHKIDATRLRWNFSFWEHPSSMRGWFLKTGYTYFRINSRANRYTEESGDGDAIPVGTILLGQDPDDETDLITDIRHGVNLGFGNRWLLMNQKLSVTLGAVITSNFKRSLTIDSKDPLAESDYNDVIESLPETKMSIRPTPEASMGIGYAW